MSAVPVQSLDPLFPFRCIQMLLTMPPLSSFFNVGALILQSGTRWKIALRNSMYINATGIFTSENSGLWHSPARNLAFYLEGHFFTLYTDQKSISQIVAQYDSQAKTTDPIDPCLQRWILQILHYNFSLLFMPGEDNILVY